MINNKAENQKWKKVRLDSVFNIQQGKQVSKANRIGNNQRPFLRTANVFWGRLNLRTLDEMNFTEAEEKKLALQKGDILVCEGGDVGRSVIWNNELENCYYQNHLHRLRKIKNNVDENFVLRWLQYEIVDNHILKGRANSTTIPNLSKSRLSELEINLPSHGEQKAIAKILTTAQDAITGQEELIEKLKKLKKSMMQHLFTYGTKNESTKMTEIGEIPESWDVREIGKVYEFTKKPRSLNIGGEIPFIPMENILIGSAHVSKYLKRTAEKITSGTYVENGDLLLAKITPSFENGKQAILKIENDFAYATTEVIPIKEIEKLSSLMYLFYFLLKEDVRSILAGKMEGSTGRQRLSKTVLEKTLIPFPNFDEQKEIAKVFESVDQKIESAQARLSTYQKLFKTLLHELMSGERRTL